MVESSKRTPSDEFSEGSRKMKCNGSALVTVCCGIGLMTVWFLPADPQSLPADRTGSEIYQHRCSVCHDHPQESVPPKDFLVSRTQEYIVNALTKGVMQGQARGLSAAEIIAVAQYLTTSPMQANSSQPKLQEPDLRANLCTKAPRPITLEGSWNGFSPNLDNARFQPKPGFRVEDIPRLRPKWTVAYPGGTVGGPPSVIAGRVFVGTAAGSVMSFDVETGCTYWATKPAERVKVPVSVAIWTSAIKRVARQRGPPRILVIGRLLFMRWTQSLARHYGRPGWMKALSQR